jgi:N utilization substance protein A
VGWRIDVRNETKYQRSLKDGYQSLLRLPGVGEAMADLLFDSGYGSAKDITEVEAQQLCMINGITEGKAKQIWQAAKEYVDNLAIEDAEEAAHEAMAKDFFSPKGEAEAEGQTEPEAETETEDEAESEDESTDESADESAEEAV